MDLLQLLFRTVVRLQVNKIHLHFLTVYFNQENYVYLYDIDLTTFLVIVITPCRNTTPPLKVFT